MNAFGWVSLGLHAQGWKLLVTMVAVMMPMLEGGRYRRDCGRWIHDACFDITRRPVGKGLIMADQPPHVTNERYRSVSRTLFQLGAALLAAGVVKVYSARQLSFETLGWLFAASVVIWIGWLVLGLLGSEK